MTRRKEHLLAEAILSLMDYADATGANRKTKKHMLVRILSVSPLDDAGHMEEENEDDHDGVVVG